MVEPAAPGARKGPGTLIWVVAMVYVGILVVAAVGAAWYVVRYWNVRAPGGYLALLERAPEIARTGGWKAALLVVAPVGLAAAALLGGVWLVLLALRRRLALWGTALAAALCVAALHLGTIPLKAIEGRYYARSQYVKLYKSGAIPLGVLSAAVALGLLGALLWSWLGSRRAAVAPGSDELPHRGAAGRPDRS